MKPVSFERSTRRFRVAGSFRAATRSAMLGNCISSFQGVLRKGIDWAITDRLHEKGFVHDPVSHTKSLALTDEGLAVAEAALNEFFSKS